MAEKLKVGNSECYYKIVSRYNNVQFMYGDIEINDVKFLLFILMTSYG